MASTRDVKDPAVREELEAAERLLDEGDYGGSVHRSAEIYQRILAARPDLRIVRERAELSAIKGQPPRPRFQPWPDALGVALVFDEDDKPLMKFEKEDFMMSEAITYFEHTLDAAVHAEEHEQIG